MPTGYYYKITSFKIVEDSSIDKETKFEATVAVNICDENQIDPFFDKFEKSSSSNYNILYGDTKNSKKNKIAGYRKCHHNIRKRMKSGSSGDMAPPPPLTVGKQTNCPASINFRLYHMILEWPLMIISIILYKNAICHNPPNPLQCQHFAKTPSPPPLSVL